ncbi:MAG: 8-amino-7-oxononanoate synthase, partial [Candidatus Eremiobacteraeota bacterium]|nr:8-amino-7-oxononanoate synthase [Candidatus Eremiobacteraeota bacterium]
MSYLNRIDALLENVRSEKQYRELPLHQLSGAIDFSSNDYLGLASDRQVLQAFHHATRVGSGGARLLAGRN